MLYRKILTALMAAVMVAGYGFPLVYGAEYSLEMDHNESVLQNEEKEDINQEKGERPSDTEEGAKSIEEAPLSGDSEKEEAQSDQEETSLKDSDTVSGIDSQNGETSASDGVDDSKTGDGLEACGTEEGSEPSGMLMKGNQNSFSPGLVLPGLGNMTGIQGIQAPGASNDTSAAGQPDQSADSNENDQKDKLKGITYIGNDSPNYSNELTLAIGDDLNLSEYRAYGSNRDSNIVQHFSVIWDTSGINMNTTGRYVISGQVDFSGLDIEAGNYLAEGCQDGLEDLCINVVADDYVDFSASYRDQYTGYIRAQWKYKIKNLADVILQYHTGDGVWSNAYAQDNRDSGAGIQFSLASDSDDSSDQESSPEDTPSYPSIGGGILLQPVQTGSDYQYRDDQYDETYGQVFSLGLLLPGLDMGGDDDPSVEDGVNSAPIAQIYDSSYMLFYLNSLKSGIDYTFRLLYDRDQVSNEITVNKAMLMGVEGIGGDRDGGDAGGSSMPDISQPASHSHSHSSSSGTGKKDRPENTEKVTDDTTEISKDRLDVITENGQSLMISKDDAVVEIDPDILEKVPLSDGQTLIVTLDRPDGNSVDLSVSAGGDMIQELGNTIISMPWNAGGSGNDLKAVTRDGRQIDAVYDEESGTVSFKADTPGLFTVADPDGAPAVESETGALGTEAAGGKGRSGIPLPLAAGAGATATVGAGGVLAYRKWWHNGEKGKE